MMPDKVVFITACDTNTYVIPGDIDRVRTMVLLYDWVETLGNKYVRTSNIVSVWVPTNEDIENYENEVK